MDFDLEFHRKQAIDALETLAELLAEAPHAGPRHVKLLEDFGVMLVEFKRRENLARVSLWWKQAGPYLVDLTPSADVMGLAGRASAALGLWNV